MVKTLKPNPQENQNKPLQPPSQKPKKRKTSIFKAIHYRATGKALERNLRHHLHLLLDLLRRVDRLNSPSLPPTLISPPSSLHCVETQSTKATSPHHTIFGPPFFIYRWNLTPHRHG